MIGNDWIHFHARPKRREEYVGPKHDPDLPIYTFYTSGLRVEMDIGKFTHRYPPFVWLPHRDASSVGKNTHRI